MIYALMMARCALVLSTAAAAGQNVPGIYRDAVGGAVGIGEFSEFGPGPFLVDYVTGEVGPLIELPSGKTGIGRAVGDRTSPPVRFVARTEGGILLDERPFKALPVERRLFEVSHDAIRLAGELVRPTARPVGVVVFVHGSGPGPRRAYDLWTNFFLSAGWAVVVFDKRGSGESTGDWHKANFVTLAGDVRRVLQWTRTQRDVAKLPLGLWGASQAGWIIPQLTVERAVDFAIIQAGATTSVDEFIGNNVESEMEGYGFKPTEITKARAYYELDAAVSRGTRAYAEVEKAYREYSAAGAEWLLGPPEPMVSPGRTFMAVIAGFDPAAYWRKVRVPILALFGGKDRIVPAERNRQRLVSLLAEAGNTTAEIVTLPNDNHLNMLAETGVRAEYATLNRFDPKYFEILTNFLSRNGKRTAPSPTPHSILNNP